MKHVITSIALVAILLTLDTMGQAGDDKAPPWKPLLPAEVYKDVTERSIQAIESAAKSGEANAAARISIEAAILRGYTLSTKNADDDAVASLRGAAEKATDAAGKKDIKALVEFSKLAKTAPKPAAGAKMTAPDLDDLMTVFRNKAKGGEGIHADLQYQPKLKNQNGIEALIGALATKKLTDANLDKVSKELVPLSYRIAILGATTHTIAPKTNAPQWRQLANLMRDSSVALAEAAQKKNGDGILKAAVNLETSCTQCHSAFKK